MLQWLKSGLERQLIAPFVIISGAIYLVTAVVLFFTMQSALRSSLEQKSTMLTQNLATVLGDPLTMGEYNHMQSILAQAKVSDKDLAYAYLVSPNGRVLAATDTDKKNGTLNESAFRQRSFDYHRL